MPSRIDQLASILVIFLVFSSTYVLARPTPNGKRVTFEEPPPNTRKASSTNLAPPLPQGQGVVSAPDHPPSDPKATPERPNIREPEHSEFVQGRFIPANTCFAAGGDTWIVKVETHEDNAGTHKTFRWKWIPSTRQISRWNPQDRKYRNENGWCYRRVKGIPIFVDGQTMGAAECQNIGGNAWHDPSFPAFGGGKEIWIFNEKLQSSTYRNRLGECYYFSAAELKEKKRTWETRKTRADRKSGVQSKGKGPEVVPRPNEVSAALTPPNLPLHLPEPSDWSIPHLDSKTGG